MRTIIYIALCLILAGIANGTHETLQHHYEQSVFPKRDEDGYLFWNPKFSWLNKYEHWPEDQSAAYFGSKTFLVWTTDGYHLTKFLYHGFMRLALVLLIVAVWGQAHHWSRGKRLLYGVGIYIAAAAVQAGGFHLMYSIILT